MILDLPKIGPVKFDDNLTEDQLMAQVDALTKKYGIDLQRSELTTGEMVSRGLTRGAKRLGSTFGDIIPAMGASALGFEDYAKKQLGEAAATEAEIQRYYRPQYGGLEDVKGIGDFPGFALETIAEQVPNIATSLVPGVGAGALAARAGAGMAGKMAAANAGVFLGSYAQNAPEVFQNIYEKTGQLETGTSLLFGAASAALDSILPATLARQLTGPLKVGIVEKVLEKSGMEPSLLRSVTAGMLKGVGTEGLTEGAQEAISITAENFVANNPQIFDSPEWKRIMESSVRGAVAGGAFGGVGGVPERIRARYKEQIDAATKQAQETGQAVPLQIGYDPRVSAPTAYGGQVIYVHPDGSTSFVSELSEAGLKEKYPEPKIEPGMTPAERKKAEKIAANQARQAAKQEAADLKAAQDQLKNAIKELTATPKNLVDLTQRPNPLIQTIAQVRQETEALGAKRGPKPTIPVVEPAQPTPTPAPTPAAAPTPVTAIGANKQSLKAFGKQLGVGPTARILREDGPLAGKDLANPADAAEVKRILEAYASGNPAAGAAAKIEEFLKRPEFQVAEMEVPTDERVTTEPISGAVEPSPPSAITGGESVGVPSTPGIREPVVGGLAETGLSAALPAEGEGVVEPALGVKEAKDVAKTEARTEEAVQKQADFVTQNDERANNALTSMLREAANTAGVDPDAIPSEDLTGTPAHSYLRLPGLLNEYFRLKDVLASPVKDPAGRAQAARNQQELNLIRDAILQSGPDMGPFLQQMESVTPQQRDGIVSEINREAKASFEPIIKQKIAEAKQAGVPPTQAPTQAKPDERLEKIRAAAQKAKPATGKAAERAQQEMAKAWEKRFGEKLFLPVHRGPDLNDAGRALVESGDVKGLIDNLRESATNKDIKHILAKIKSLNLKTKIVVGDPNGPMALSVPEFREWFKGSKVVDEKGNPLVVYHGTNVAKTGERQIEEFKVTSFFDTSPKFAGRFTHTGRIILEGDPTGGVMYPAYLSIKKPKKIRRARYGATYVNEAYDRKVAIKEGYDGIVYEYPDNRGHKSYVVFNPNQIKSIYSIDPTEVSYAENKAGSYDPRTNTITIDPNLGMNEHTVLHELMHAAISHVLRNENLPVSKQLIELFGQIRNQLGNTYGAQDIQEFASELTSNPEFQALLKTIKAPRSGSMFQKFMQVLAEFFGFAKGTNAYERGIKLVNDALDISSDIKPEPADLLFLGTPNGQRTGFRAVSEVGQSMPILNSRMAESVANMFSNAPSSVTYRAMGLLRLDNINTIYGKDIPALQPLLDALELRNGKQERAIEQINTKYKQFQKVYKKNTAAFERMQDMAYDARLAQVDVLDPNFSPSPSQVPEYNRLKAIYNGLPTAVQDVYKTIRADYENAINQYEDLLLASVTPSLAAKLKAEFQARKRQIAYIPFLRRGEYWVEYEDNGERAASAFESIRERDRFVKEVLQGKEHRLYQNIQNATFQQGSLPPTSFIVRIMNDLNKQGASAAMKDSVYQAYLALFPGQSIAKNFMKADNVRGMERDILRGYGETMIKWARKLANSEYTPQIDRALNDVGTQAQNSGRPDLVAVAQNVLEQRDFLHNPTFNGLTHAATTTSYFAYIAGNVSSALVNLSTLPMFSWSVLGGRFGFGDASSSLLNASKTTIDYIFNNKVPAKYRALFDVLNDHGQLQHTMAREVLEGRRQATSDYTGAKARIMDLVSSPFHKTEILNRGATAIAAYDLALRGNPALGIKPMNQQDAIRYALKTVKDINTSAMAATAPRYMQSGLGRVFFTFKSFVWNSAFVVARAFHQAAKGQTPEIQREARRQLLGIIGMSGALGGVNALPFMGIASTTANMIHALFGDDDEPFDFDTEMRNWFGDLAYKGALNYALNLEISNRIGVAQDLIFRDDPRSVAEHGYVLTAMKQAFGPVGSLIAGTEQGFKAFEQGEIMRGMESMVPSFVRNFMKGYRFAQEGATNLKGEPIVEDISAYNALMQIVGFSPAHLSNAYEEIGMKKDYERKILARRNRLLDKYDMARKAGDSELLSETRAEIEEYNSARQDPKARITADTLARSERARKAAEANTINGVRFNKSLMSEINQLVREAEE